LSDHLTNAIKQKVLPRHLEEFGFNCYQCRESLEKKTWVYDHLDDNRRHNEYSNLAICCQSCNIKKANDFDMKFIALDLKKQREEASIKYVETPDAIEETSSERDVNKMLFPLTEQIISERVNTDGNYPLKDALAEIPYISQKRYGCGAEPTVRRYLKQLTSKLAPFEIVTDEKGIKLICKRMNN